MHLTIIFITIFILILIVSIGLHSRIDKLRDEISEDQTREINNLEKTIDIRLSSIDIDLEKIKEVLHCDLLSELEKEKE
jgi:hypothetical protein